MASGCTVIASNVGGMPSLLGPISIGLLFEPENATAISGSVRRLAENRALLSSITRESFKLVRDSLSWDNVARQTMEIYEATLKR